MQVLALALPRCIKHQASIITGCGVGIEAFASPILAAIIIPPLITTSGFTPKEPVSKLPNLQIFQLPKNR